jgi:hypothetical protein
MATPKNKVSGVPGTDPTLPSVEWIDDSGKKHYLCFTFQAIAVAQKVLRDEGVDCNILFALEDFQHTDSIRIPALLYAALIPNEPKITYAEAQALITMKNYGKAHVAVVRAYVVSVGGVDPVGDEKENPKQPE